ncbi:MAG: tetratricopeptide repeat protein [Thermoanaerobaculia bacterium]
MSGGLLDRWDRLGPILERALELEGETAPEELARYLDQACGGDETLRADLERLLAAERGASGFLESPAGRYAATLMDDVRARSEGPGFPGAVRSGTQIGRYRILEEIGSGGMSRVYLAERDDDVFRQRVALKVMRLVGAQREERERRFRTERQLLATLEHPGIARILDGGISDDARPYLVMELVEGLSLDRYCDDNGLDVEARLRLFVRICEAVHFAHQRLIVHRDLKPSNILVDAAGRPKLLDFGIAKLLDEEADESGAGGPRTRTGLLLMTPEYAAPEQVRGESVTTSTDIWALGVMLYELVTGSRPFDLANKSPSQIESEIVTRNPAPLSARAGGRAAALPPHRRRDLDAILQTALEKEPGRRYRSAAELADDLGRLLSERPVHARPATRRYRLARFVRRHRWGVAAAGTLVAIVVAGIVALALEQRRTVAERNRARYEAAKAGQIADFLRGLFEASDPAESKGVEITARELLGRGRERADQLAANPLLQADLLEVIGSVYRSLGSFEVAEEELRRALEIRTQELPAADPRIAESRAALAGVLTKRGSYEEAGELYASALADLTAAAGAADARTLAVRNDQAQLARVRGDYVEAGKQFEAVLADKEKALGPGHESVAATLSDFADLLVEQGESLRAEEHLRRAGSILDEALGDDHPRSLVVKQRLARAYLERGDYDAAEKLGNEIVAIQRRSLGPNHPAIADTLNSTLGPVHYFRGDFAAAEATYREIVDIRTAALGAEHPDVAIALGNLSMMLVEQGRMDEGEAMARRTLELKRRIHEPGHASIASSLHTLAVILQRRGKAGEAEPLLREALAIRLEQLGPHAPRVASIRHELGVVATDQGRYAEAEAAFLKALAIRRESQEPTHPHIRADLEALAGLYEKWRKPDRAAAVRREIAELFPEKEKEPGGS